MSDRLRADETPVERVAGTFPVVLANIEAKTLVELAPAILARVSPGGLLVLSGILAPTSRLRSCRTSSAPTPP